VKERTGIGKGIPSARSENTGWEMDSRQRKAKPRIGNRSPAPGMKTRRREFISLQSDRDQRVAAVNLRLFEQPCMSIMAIRIYSAHLRPRGKVRHGFRGLR